MDFDALPLTPTEPQYGTGALSDILPSVLSLLDVPGETDRLGLSAELAGVRRVGVLLVDGLGRQLYPVAATASPVIGDALAGRYGTLRRLTTGFPSTTPTSLVSLGTGAPPGEHGVLGFTVNLPGTDRVLTHILWGEEPDPMDWQPLRTCFERGAAAGVACSVVSRIYPSTGLSRAAFRGGRQIDATGGAEVVTGMRKAMAEGDRSLVYGYFPHVDKMGHEHGVGSDAWLTAVGDLDTVLGDLTADLPPDSAIIVTADHGMINVADSDRIDVAADPRLRDGVRVIAGEPRARYVHTEPGATETVTRTWRRTLGDRAIVATRDEAIAAGWFGTVPAAHTDRIGDLIVIGRERTVLVNVPEADGPVTALLRGYHGATTEAELAIPLLTVRGG